MLGEFDIIARYFTRPAHSAGLGVGDDAALVVAPTGLTLAITTDMLLEGRHFLAGADARKLGHKALAVNLSDLAAMGADPRWFTLSIALPDVNEPWLAAFSGGMFRLADAHRCELIGGDTTRGPLTISITAIGTLPTGCALRRDGAVVGDDVWVSGATGDAALALAHTSGRTKLSDADAAACFARLDTPEPRIALGRKLRNVANAAIDVSDGLAADLGHILERSSVGAEIRLDALPRSAAIAACPDLALATDCLLAGGDDYELVFTASPGKRDAVEKAGSAASVPVTRIGRVVEGNVLSVLDADDRPMSLDRSGFDHFAPR